MAGLVGITPAVGFTGIGGAIATGMLTSFACYLSVAVLKRKLGYDDSLDTFGIHGFGGLVGAVLTGVFFGNTVFGGEAEIGSQLLIQLKDALTTVAYSGIMSIVILWGVSKICGGLRVARDVEREGLDLNIHGERVE